MGTGSSRHLLSADGVESLDDTIIGGARAARCEPIHTKTKSCALLTPHMQCGRWCAAAARYDGLHLGVVALEGLDRGGMAGIAAQPAFLQLLDKFAPATHSRIALCDSLDLLLRRSEHAPRRGPRGGVAHAQHDGRGGEGRHHLSVVDAGREVEARLVAGEEPLPVHRATLADEVAPDIDVPLAKPGSLDDHLRHVVA